MSCKHPHKYTQYTDLSDPDRVIVKCASCDKTLYDGSSHDMIVKAVTDLLKEDSK